MQRREIGHLSGGYLLKKDSAIGQVTRRPVQLGQALLSNYLKPPTIIRRGQNITLLARLNSFEVRSSGEALMDGAVGQRIKVLNRRSKRVVEGVVSPDSTVFVN